MNKAPAVILVILITLVSCKTAKHATGLSAIKPEKMAPQALLDSTSKHHINFEWLSFKARVDYDGPKRSENFTANVRMRKDSVIWISITALMGVEVARLLVTRDSVEILDKMKKVHTKKPFSFLESYAPFPLDIDRLQDLLSGNYLLDTAGDLKSKVEKDHHVLLVENPNFDTGYSIEPTTYRLAGVVMKEKGSGRQLNVDLKDYRDQDGHEFSYERTLDFKATKNKVKMRMRFSRITWNEPLSFPFYVSDKYD